MKEQAVETIRPAVEYLQTTGLSFGMRVVSSLVILVLGALAIRAVSAFLRTAVEQRVKGENEMLVRFVTSVTVKTCWAFLLVLVLGKLGVEVGPLIAGLGATGLVVGFAFQESLGSLAAGVMIALNKPFKVGDFVTVAGFEGTVKALDMMAVVLATVDNRRVTIPNKSAWGAPIVNYSALDVRRIDFSYSVAYGSDLKKVRDVVMKTLTGLEGVIAEPATEVAITSLDSSSIAVSARVWSRTCDYWLVRNAGIEAVNNAFVAEGIVQPFPQVDVHMIA